MKPFIFKNKYDGNRFALLFGVFISIIIFMAGCSSQSGQSEPESDIEMVRQSFSEECRQCHDKGSFLSVADVHGETESMDIIITDVTIPDPGNTGGRPTVTFSVYNDQGAGLGGLSGFGFTIAKLIETSGVDSNYWQSYINETQTVGETPPAWPSAQGDVAPDGTVGIQAALEYDNMGELTDLGKAGGPIGVYRYTFATDIGAITTQNGAVKNVSYEPGLTHRITVESPRQWPAAAAVHDFRPEDDETDPDLISGRDVVVSNSCNQCHYDLAAHGGHRTHLEYCAVCHNPGSIDPHSSNNIAGGSLDMKVMVHKIHSGADLPSVKAGNEYAVWGHFNAKNDFSDIAYPQDVRNCEKCHSIDSIRGTGNTNNKMLPTTRACGSCHDDIVFSTGLNHPGGIQEDNQKCVECHPPEGIDAAILNAHSIVEKTAAENFQYNILTIENTTPGYYPVVTISVTDPEREGFCYDIHKDPEFTAPRGLSRLGIMIGWDTGGYHNTGSLETPGQPIKIDALKNSTANPDGSFTITSPVPIPNEADGTGIVAIEGHPAVESILDSGIYDVSVPVKNSYKYFIITGTRTFARRAVVDINRCNACHDGLSAHGNNRSGEINVCVVCHNGKATDLNQRPLDTDDTLDGKTEETIDFKYMIHAIHAGSYDFGGFRENGIVLYGYGEEEYDYSHTGYPGKLQNCLACHLPETYELSSETTQTVTSYNTGEDHSTPDDDTGVTPVSSACSSCHDHVEAKIHMADKGGNFNFNLYAPVMPENEPSPCGPDGNKPQGHTTSMDCCSCH